jgi:hypothetical protein
MNQMNSWTPFDVCKSVHHHTIQIIQPTRCTGFTSLLLDVYVWLNVFRASPRPSSGAYNCTRGLWFYRWRRAAGALLVVVWQVTHTHTRTNTNTHTRTHITKQYKTKPKQMITIQKDFERRASKQSWHIAENVFSSAGDSCYTAWGLMRESIGSWKSKH